MMLSNTDQSSDIHLDVANEMQTQIHITKKISMIIKAINTFFFVAKQQTYT